MDILFKDEILHVLLPRTILHSVSNHGASNRFDIRSPSYISLIQLGLMYPDNLENMQLHFCHEILLEIIECHFARRIFTEKKSRNYMTLNIFCLRYGSRDAP